MKKIEIATAIVKATPDKKAALDRIVAEMAVSRANAFVYFTKAAKTLGIATTMQKVKPVEIVTEVEPEGKEPAGTNPITGLTPQKKARKVAKIDKFIDKVKQNAGKTPETIADVRFVPVSVEVEAEPAA